MPFQLPNFDSGFDPGFVNQGDQLLTQQNAPTFDSLNDSGNPFEGMGQAGQLAGVQSAETVEGPGGFMEGFGKFFSEPRNVQFIANLGAALSQKGSPAQLAGLATGQHLRGATAASFNQDLARALTDKDKPLGEGTNLLSAKSEKDRLLAMLNLGDATPEQMSLLIQLLGSRVPGLEEEK